MRFVLGLQQRKVDVGHPVGIGDVKCPVVRQLRRRALDPAAGLGLDSRLHTDDLETRRPVAACDELLDHLALVADAQHEPVDTLAGVDLDYMPEDRPAADLDKRLGYLPRVFLETGAAPAAEDRNGA